MPSSFCNVEDRLKTIPLLAVGPQSLAMAQENGFKFAEAHGGDVQGLAAHVAAKFDPQKGPVLYLSGAETSADLQALLMASGFAVERVITYDAVIQTPDDIGLAVKGADGVLLYSPRTCPPLVRASSRIPAWKEERRPPSIIACRKTWQKPFPDHGKNVSQKRLMKLRCWPFLIDAREPVRPVT